MSVKDDLLTIGTTLAVLYWAGLLFFVFTGRQPWPPFKKVG